MPSQISNVPNGKDQKKPVSAAKLSGKSPLVWGLSFALLIVIVIAFVVWPISMPMAGNSGGGYYSFGSYNGKEIASHDGNFFYDQFSDYQKNQGRGRGESETMREAFHYAFNQTVSHFSKLDLAKAAQFSASDKAVGEAIRNDPAFQENGKFNEAKFRKLFIGETEKIREKLVAARVDNDLYSSIVDSPKETGFIIDMARWTRSFEYVSFVPADYPDSEVIAFAQKNPKLFRTMDLSVITLPTQADATNYRQQIIDKKVSFEDTAKSHSVDIYKDKSGQRGSTAYHELQYELTDKTAPDTIFNLKSGELSPVLTAPSGFVIVRSNGEAKPANTADLAQITLIRNYITGFEKGTIEAYLSAKAKEFSEKSKSGSFQQAAKAIGKKVLETNQFPINYGALIANFGQSFPVMNYPTDANNQAISDSYTNEGFFTEAFKIKNKEVSNPIVLQDMVVVLTVKTDKQAPDQEINMLMRVAQYLPTNFLYKDADQFLIKKDKIVDNVEKTYQAHFVARQ